MAFLGLGALFLDCPLELVQFLAQLCKRLFCRIGFLSAFLGIAEMGFLCPIILTTVSCVVRSMRTPMFLAEVPMLLGAYFIGDSDSTISTRLLVSFFALVGSFLARLCTGLFLHTYVLYSLKRHKKQMHVHGSHTFLMKVELVLSRKWAHLENVTYQVSLCEWNIHWSCVGLDSWAVEPAWQLHDVGIELLHRLHKLMHADALGFLEHVCQVVPFLLSHVVGEHGEKVEHHTVIK